MSEIFFTSDTHFNHNQDFVYAARGFTSPIEMGEAILDRWNELIKPHDIVYHLGDFAFGSVDTPIFRHTTLGLIKQLNGHIIWIAGNHDSSSKIQAICEACPNIHYPIWATLLRYHKHQFYMSHYPTLTANFDDRHFNQHVIALHGHTHQTKNFLFPENPFCYHVGIDSHDCAPVHIEEVLTDIRNRWNGIAQLPGLGIHDPFFTRTHDTLGDYVEQTLESQETAQS